MKIRPLKVLVADDYAPIHQLFQSALQDYEGMEIVHAHDGLECLEALEHGIDLAFIDVLMPKMNGTEALSGARRRGNKTFVTLITGKAGEQCADIARQLDVYELLMKPFRKREIRAVLDTYLRISAPMRVLFVDASETMRKVAHKVLGGSIFRLEIEEAANGKKALALFEAEHFDVVFWDCDTPELDEIETLARLRRHNPQIKVVMMSAEHNIAREREAARLGAAGWLHKPFYPGEIDAVLHVAFGLHSPTLATDGRLRDFGIKIHGRTVMVEHQSTGHIYEYVWFREAPYLRLPTVRQNPSADVPPADLRAEAERAAVIELMNASLLDRSAHSAKGG